VQAFYPEVESFTKNGDKFGWVKYWREPNSPKFSPPQFALYDMYIAYSTVATFPPPHNYVPHAVFKN